MIVKDNSLRDLKYELVIKKRLVLGRVFERGQGFCGDCLLQPW